MLLAFCSVCLDVIYTIDVKSRLRLFKVVNNLTWKYVPLGFAYWLRVKFTFEVLDLRIFRDVVLLVSSDLSLKCFNVVVAFLIFNLAFLFFNLGVVSLGFGGGNLLCEALDLSILLAVV